MGENRWSWEVFVGCMFIGMGVGMIFNHSGAGTLLGMGIGFILSSIIRINRSEKRPVFQVKTVSPIIGLVGLFFIILGLQNLGLLHIPSISYEILWGVLLILLGVTFIVGSIKLLAKSNR